jgi:riboflavin biosynthesis pyrimidine reductase
VKTEGRYLAHRLDRRGTSSEPFVYSNYVVSLDGRIALEYPHSGHTGVPKTITSAVDWRLYQELAAQADVLLTSGRYLRELAAGKAQDGLPVGENFPDLLAWRREQGLEEQPAVVILSRSLDLPLEIVLQDAKRKVYVATGANADKRRLAAVAETGVPVLLAGEDKEVDGCRLIEELGAKGYRSIYSIAGPGLLDTLLRAAKVDRLYLTQVHTLLGGQCYDTLLESQVLEPAARFELEELYFDRGDDERQGQMFGVYRRGRE